MTLQEIGLYYVSRTVKFFIADSLSKQRVQFQKEEEVVSIQRNLQDASTRYKMWTFVWSLIQAIWLRDIFEIIGEIWTSPDISCYLGIFVHYFGCAKGILVMLEEVIWSIWEVKQLLQGKWYNIWDLF